MMVKIYSKVSIFVVEQAISFVTTGISLRAINLSFNLQFISERNLK